MRIPHKSANTFVNMSVIAAALSRESTYTRRVIIHKKYSRANRAKPSSPIVKGQLGPIEKRGDRPPL